MGVITVSAGSTMLVASRRPPRPTSITAVCTFNSRNNQNAMAATVSKVTGMRIEIERAGGLVDHVERSRKLGLRDGDAVDLNALGGFD